MRPIKVTLSAQGVSPWIPVNRLQKNFAIGLSIVLSSGAALTAKVQHTFDQLDSDAKRSISISRTTTTATVTDANHGLSVGDSVVIENTGSSNLNGTITVASVPTANTYTYTVANTGATADTGFATGKNLRVFDHATLTGLTARADGNYAFPIAACRLNITAYTSGTADLLVEQGA